MSTGNNSQRVPRADRPRRAAATTEPTITLRNRYLAEYASKGPPFALTPDIALKLAGNLATGEPTSAIAEHLGLSRQTVRNRERRGALLRMVKGHGLTVAPAPIPVPPQPE